MEFILLISGLLFCISFVIFIFLKSYIDNKKEKKLMTEIFMKYGVKTNAKIYEFVEHHYYGGFIPGKYNFRLEFQYNSTKNWTGSCYYVFRLIIRKVKIISKVEKYLLYTFLHI